METRRKTRWQPIGLYHHRARPGAIIVLLLLLTSLNGYSQQNSTLFRYLFEPGERYRILSQVNQSVYQDGFYLFDTTQVNRIQVEVLSVEPQPVQFAAPRPWNLNPNSQRAFHRLFYQNTALAQSAFQVLQLEREYTAEFWRDDQGYFDIGTQYFVPTVQNVPVFPPWPLQPGDQWNAPGIEVHDLRGDFFGLNEPFRFSMPVQYRYLGEAQWEGGTYHLLEIQYQVYYPTRLPRLPRTNPRIITGFSNQLMYWDANRGRPVYYEEEYELSLILMDGTTITFAGTADARVIDHQPLNRSETLQDLTDQLDSAQIRDVSVRETDQGISLVLEDIQFLPDSSALLPSEEEKLRQIAQILMTYPDRELLVTGHTALAGTPQGRQQLSDERARVVGQFLLDLGIRDRSQIMFQGLGANDPIGDNATEEGRRKNRRVEILILD